MARVDLLMGYGLWFMVQGVGLEGQGRKFRARSLGLGVYGV